MPIDATAKPAEVRVTLDPMTEHVVIVVGDFSFGLPVLDAVILANHIQNACAIIAVERGGPAQ